MLTQVAMISTANNISLPKQQRSWFCLLLDEYVDDGHFWHNMQNIGSEDGNKYLRKRTVIYQS